MLNHFADHPLQLQHLVSPIENMVRHDVPCLTFGQMNLSCNMSHVERISRSGFEYISQGSYVFGADDVERNERILSRNFRLICSFVAACFGLNTLLRMMSV